MLVPGRIHTTKGQTDRLCSCLALAYGSAYAFGGKDFFSKPLGLFDELLSNDQPFIFVTSNYRMGLYGWASSPYEDMDSNIGLEDGRLALEWTQKHISKFGGNPENVIAMGQSAGAGILELIIAESRYQKIPFQRALLSSSDLPPKRTVTAQREEIYQTLLDLTKCTTLQCIKALSEAELSEVNDIMVSKMQNYGGGGNFGPGMGFGPLVDGKTVHDLTPVLLSEQHHKTGLQGLIVGSMQNEVDVSSRVDARDTDFFQASTLSSDQDMPQAFPSLVRRILRSASNATASTVQSLYHYPQDLPEKLAWDWTGDAVFFCHALALVVRFKEITRRYIMSIPPTVHAQDLSCEFQTFFDM